MIQRCAKCLSHVIHLIALRKGGKKTVSPTSAGEFPYREYKHSE